MEVRLLGELEVEVDGSTAEVRGVKARTLVAVLALHRGEPVAPERLIDILWGEEPPGNPTNALQALVATLRRTVGGSTVVTTDAGYALRIGSDDLDIGRFERLVTEGRRDLDEGDAAAASYTLRAATSLCRDEPLVEFAYAEFASGERARLQELVLVAVEGRIEADLALGRHVELVAELESLCEQHPFRERLWELCMLALYRAGRQAEALRAFGDARVALVEELGLEPGPALRELEARILDQDPSLDHQPVGRAPAAPSEGNLRAPITSFVGRDSELARVLDLSAASRLVTVIGPGGAGKTRLAVEAALRMRGGADHGVWIVELAGVRDPAAVTPAVAAALDVARSDGSSVSSLDLVVRHLRGRSLVVVLDNCEHVIAEAAVVAEALVGGVDDLRLLATSREALGVPGEVLMPLGGLALDAAVDVFADRALAVQPSFAVDDDRPVVEDVCRRLDGLPLAVELAAARLRALPLAQLATLLDDRFRVLTGGARTALPRQQTLRAVVDWSHDLLFEDERRLFARLAVFAGGCTLDAAEAVCGDDLLPADEILDLLLHLVDKSLVVADVETGRYDQLQTLWQYGLERLAESGEGDALRHRHADWFLGVAEAARRGLRGGTGPQWRGRLFEEWENLRAARDWFVDTGDADSALTLTDGIAWVWFLVGDLHAAVQWLDDVLAVPGASTDAHAIGVVWRAFYQASVVGPVAPLEELTPAIAALRAGTRLDRLSDALLIAAELHNQCDQIDESNAALDEARAVFEQTGDEWGLAAHDSIRARNLAVRGELDAAEASARASVDQLRGMGEQWLVFEGLGSLAIIIEARGDLERAAATYEELVAEAHDAGVPNYEALWVFRLAGVRARQGQDDEAARCFVIAAAGAHQPVNVGWALIGASGACRRMGDASRAAELLDEALQLYASLGLDLGRSAALTSRSWGALADGRVDDAAADAADAARLAEIAPESRFAAAAGIVGAAVSYARSCSAGDRDALLKLVDERSRAGTWRYDLMLGGTVGEYFDEPDVAVFVSSLI